MAKHLRLDIIAEGAATQGRTFLREAGCSKMQGALFSRPLPPQELGMLVRGAEAAAR